MFIDKCTQTTVGLQVSVENNAVLQAFRKITKTDVQILYHIFNYQNIYTALFFARETIAKKVGISVKQFTRRTNFLRDLGLLLKKRPDGKPFDVCTYTLTEMALQLKKRIISSYHYYKRMGFALGVPLLLSTSAGPRRDVPLYSLKDSNYTKTTDCSSENLFLKLYSIYCETKKRREYVLQHQYPTENREIESLTTKKESSMEQPKWVTPTLNSVTKTLNLSKWGQIRLSAYPDQALFHALNTLKASKSPKNDLFKWFGSVCNEWCKKNNVSPNWSVMHKLATENEMPDDPTLILAAKPMDIPKAKAKTDSSVMDKVVQDLRQKNRDRIALQDPNDIAQERAYLASNPHMLAFGLKLGVDMTRWGIENAPETLVDQVVTEVKDQIVCAQIAHDEVVWDNLTYSPIEGDEVYEEIYD